MGVQGKEGARFWIRPFFEGRLESPNYLLASTNVLHANDGEGFAILTCSHRRIVGFNKFTTMMVSIL